MAELNVSALVLAVVVLGTLVMLFALVGESRRMAHEGPNLPLWMFLRRRGQRRDAVIDRMGERAVRVMELRCSSCGSRADCLERLAQGTAKPPADCPNATWFQR